MSEINPILSFLRVSRSDKRNPATAPGFLLPRIQPSGGAREAESQKQSAGARQNGMGGGRTPSWRDRLLAPSTHRRVFASRCRHGLAHPQKESVVLPVARTALGKAWTSIAGSATYGNNTGSPCTLTSHACGVARDRNSEIDAKGRRRWDGLWPTARKDERTYSGPLHSQGLFRFRLPTPIAPSWECSGRRIYQSPQGGGNPDAKHA